MSALKLNLGNVAAAAAANTAPGIAGALNARDDNAAAQRERAFGDLLSHSGSQDSSQPGAGKPTHADLHPGRHKQSGDAAHDALAWVASSRATAAGLHAHPAAEAAVAAAHAMPTQKTPAAKSDGIDAVGGGARRGEASHAATARPPSSQDRTPRDGVAAGSNGGSGKPAAIEGDRSARAPAPVAPGADEAPRAGDAARTDATRQSVTAANTGAIVLAADTAASTSTSAEAPLDTSGSPSTTNLALASASGTGAAAVPFSAADTSAPAAATAPPTLAFTPTNAPAAPSAPGDVRGDGMRLGLVATIKPLVTNATIPAGPATTALDPTALPVAARITLTDTAPAAASASDATSAAFIAATAAAVAGATAQTAAAAQSSTSADAAMAATGANPSANDTTSLAQAPVADTAIAASGPTLTTERAAALSDVFASTPFGAALEKTGPRRDTDTTAEFDVRSAANAVAGAIGPSGSAPQSAGMLDAKTAVPAVHDPQFADALGSRLSWLAERHIGSAQISLSPAALGPLDVRVHVSGERVRAEFASNHAGVRDAITAHVPRLRELLAQRGFTLTDAQVGSGHAHAQPQTAAPSTPAHASDADGSAITTAGEPAPTLRVAHDGLIDAFA